MNFLKKAFANNGVARGLLYAAIAVLTSLTAAFTVWEQKPPPNWYAIAAVITGAFANAGLTIRAYLDQHLSNTKNGQPTKSTKVSPGATDAVSSVGDNTPGV